MKDDEVFAVWLKVARQVVGVEMESAGVYRAAQRVHRQYPVLTVRGISDIVGLNRSNDWTAYACETAAGFARAVIESEPFVPSRSGDPGLGVAAKAGHLLGPYIGGQMSTLPTTVFAQIPTDRDETQDEARAVPVIVVEVTNRTEQVVSVELPHLRFGPGARFQSVQLQHVRGTGLVRVEPASRESFHFVAFPPAFEEIARGHLDSVVIKDALGKETSVAAEDLRQVVDYISRFFAKKDLPTLARSFRS